MSHEILQNKTSVHIHLQRVVIVLVSSCVFILAAHTFSFIMMNLDETPLNFIKVFLISLCLYLMVGWYVFAKPYSALINSQRSLKLAKKRAEESRSFRLTIRIL